MPDYSDVICPYSRPFSSPTLTKTLFQFVLRAEIFDLSFYQRFFKLLIDLNKYHEVGPKMPCENVLLLSIRESGVFPNFNILFSSLPNIGSLDSIAWKARSIKYESFYKDLCECNYFHKSLIPILRAILLYPCVGNGTTIFLSSLLINCINEGFAWSRVYEFLKDVFQYDNDQSSDSFYILLDLLSSKLAIRPKILKDVVELTLITGSCAKLCRLLDYDLCAEINIAVTHFISCEQAFDLPDDHDIEILTNRSLIKYPLKLLLDHLNSRTARATPTSVRVQNLQFCDFLSFYQASALARTAEIDFRKSYNPKYLRPLKCILSLERMDEFLSETTTSNNLEISLLRLDIRSKLGHAYEQTISDYNELLSKFDNHWKISLYFARHLDLLIQEKTLDVAYWSQCITSYVNASCVYSRAKTPIMCRILSLIMKLFKRNHQLANNNVAFILERLPYILPFQIRACLSFSVAFLKNKNSSLYDLNLRLIQSVSGEYAYSVCWYLLGVQKEIGDKPGFINLMSTLGAKWKAYIDFNSKIQKINKIKSSELNEYLDSLQNDNLLISAPLHKFLSLKHVVNDEFHFVKIKKFLNYHDVMKSLQKPVKLWFLCEDGTKMPLLYKFNDEIRKDNRVLDFFEHLNVLRKGISFDSVLTVYTAIPLSENAGIIEWVEGVQPIRTIIQNHLKIDCRELDMVKCKNILVGGRDGFRKLCEMYPPVLHRFYNESFVHSDDWLIAKTVFAGSAAVASMIGYFLGLGDRHCENILINEETGGCVHVDYSCLFDKAKTFEIPETVPFRLTQNMQRAMKIAGHSQAFEKYSVATCRIAKKGVIDLVGLLEALVIDPLIEWKKGGLGAIDGEYMTTFVKERIKGSYSEQNSTNSEKAFVNELIRMATSEENLSKMYFGWAPFL